MTSPLDHHDVTLVEVLDRVVDKGVLLTGDITLAVADIDLIYLGLRVLLASADTAQRLGGTSTDSPTQ